MSELVAWIDKLNGLTRVELRHLMVSENIQGRCDDDNACVIAEFLKRKGVTRVSVNTENSISFVNDEICDNDLYVDHGPELAAFICAFDAGDYPELIVGMRTDDPVPG